MVDPDLLSLVQTLPVRGATGAIAFGEGGRVIYLGTLNDGLHIIERDTLRTTVVREGIATTLSDIVMMPDGARLCLALETGGLKSFDTRTRQLTTVWTDRCPQSLALDASGRYLYVSAGMWPWPIDGSRHH